MRIAVGSAFRDCEGAVARYADRVAALALHAGPSHSVEVIAAVGDCSDSTARTLARALARAGVAARFVPCDHGGPRFGSTEEPARLEALTLVGNAILDGVREDDDVLLYAESDLAWDPHTAGTMIDMAADRRGGFDVFAPLVFAGDLFYDVWGFRINGERFSPFPPYHIALADGLCEVDSVGSFLAMRGEIARTVRMPPGGCLVGFCDEARRAGHRIAVAPNFRVAHPC